MVLSQRKIRELHSTNESSKKDFKAQYSAHLRTKKNRAEFAKDVCAIANHLYQTSGKGYLIIGTDNNRVPVGINHSDYNETRLQQILSSRSDPPPTFSVHPVNYLGVGLVIVELVRNPAGPHQLIKEQKGAGFPIRRGSTTHMMTTNEVFQAMQSRGRTFSRQRSEYETLNQRIRASSMRDDCQSGLTELGFAQDSIVSMDYSGYGRTSFTYHPPRNFLRIIRLINSRRWQIYISFLSEGTSRWAQLSIDGPLEGFLNEKSLPKHRAIFIFFIHGNFSNTYFTNRIRSFGDLIRIPINPRITYFGLGEGGHSDRHPFSIYTPKFFVSHVKSKDDMKTRIELILNWIEQNRQLFEDIREYFRRGR